jgi:hypothetical protein
MRASKFEPENLEALILERNLEANNFEFFFLNSVFCFPALSFP